MSDEDKVERSYHALAESSADDAPTDVTGFTRQELIEDFLARHAGFREIGRR